MNRCSPQNGASGSSSISGEALLDFMDDGPLARRDFEIDKMNLLQGPRLQHLSNGN